MTDAAPAGHVGTVARALGGLGLAPQAIAVGLVASGEVWAAGIAVVYPLLILSFLGGAWWGLAMRGVRQGPWVAVAIAPSLIALALAALVTFTGGSGWSLVAIGVAVILTLPVDRALVAAGLAPDNWMGLRTPLSLGLGALTIAGGAIVG